MSTFILYHGEDSYLSFLQAKERAKQLNEDLKDSAILTVEADTTDSTTIISKITSTDMFSSKKVVFLKRISKNKDKERLTETLTTLLQTEDGTPVIFWEDHKVNGVTRFYKFFKKNNAVEEFAPMKQPSFVKWAREQLEKRGIETDAKSTSLLSQRVNFQTERLINEIEKLSLAGIEKLTQDTVVENTSDTIEFTIWKLIDAINANNREETMRIVETLINNGEDVHYILAMIARNTRLLALTKDLLDRGHGSKEIASKLRVPPFTVFPMIKAVQKMTTGKIRSIYEKLAGLDYSIKVGEIDDKLGLTLLLTKL